MSDVKNVSEALFERVAGIMADSNIKPLRASTFSEKARVYGLYKRGTVGRLNPPFTDGEDIEVDKRPDGRPGILSVTARAKYDAWDACQGMTKQEARDEYVRFAEELVGPPVTEALKEQS